MRLTTNFVLLALASAPLCQTPAATPQSFTGRRFILRSIGEFSKSKLKKSELANLKGNCDIAVVVTDADWRSGTVSLKIMNIGMPHVSGQRPSPCPSAKESTTLQISGFAADEPPASVATALRLFLQTPEEYLAAKGIAFSIAPGPDDEDVLKRIIIGPSKGTSHRRPVGSIKLQGIAPTGVKMVGYGDRGIMTFFVVTSNPEAARQEIAEKVGLLGPPASVPLLHRVEGDGRLHIGCQGPNAGKTERPEMQRL